MTTLRLLLKTSMWGWNLRNSSVAIENQHRRSSRSFNEYFFPMLTRNSSTTLWTVLLTIKQSMK